MQTSKPKRPPPKSEGSVCSSLDALIEELTLNSKETGCPLPTTLYLSPKRLGQLALEFSDMARLDPTPSIQRPYGRKRIHYRGFKVEIITQSVWAKIARGEYNGR